MTNDMKKIAYIALATLALSACQREVDFQTKEAVPTHTVTIKAGLETGTRTAYSDEGVFSWAAGDKIGVLVTDGTTVQQVTFTTADAKPVAEFTGEVPDGFTVGDYASYPFFGDEENDFVYDTAKQGWKLSGAIRPDPEKSLAGIPLVGAKDASGFFQFKTAVGIVKFTVENVPSATVYAELQAAEPGKLSGVFGLHDNGFLPMDKALDAVDIACTYQAPADKNTTMDFYFFVPAGTLAAGTEFRLRNNAADAALAIRTFKQPVEVAANRIVNVAPIALEPEAAYSRQTDSLALVAVYNASDGASWKSDRVWDLTKPMDEWYGVTLKDGRVTALKLLKATITKDWTMPADLADLTELTDLRFIDCKVNGAIPEKLYDLANLTAFYLTNNKVTGTLSEKVGQWTEMTNLYIDQNPDLGGELPKALGTLKKLVNLNVSKTSFSGTIPSEITGCDALKNFMAYETKFSGEVPDFWDQMASLELVQLYNIPTLTGGLPASFGNCKKLKNIYMYGNNLTGNIPEAWANLPTSVINVRIMDNKLKGVVPASIQAHAKWSNWKPELYILPQQEGYGLTLVDYRQVDSLALVAVYNAAKGAEWTKNNWDLAKPMDEWTGVTLTGDRVTALKLNVSGVIPQEWTLPSEIGDLTELTDLRINSNKLTGELPDALYDLAKLEKLYFQNDNLTGALSSKLGQLTELVELYIDRNANMTGGIPKEIGNLKKLTRLNISQSGIGGEIPAELGQCDALLQLMAFKTNLSGSLPDIWDVPVLQTVMLHTNPGLTGELPSSLSKLKPLSSGTAPSIQLYGCNFTGNIPESFAELPATTKQVFLEQNKMSGVIPAAVQAHTNFSNWRYSPQQEGYGLTLE